MFSSSIGGRSLYFEQIEIFSGSIAGWVGSSGREEKNMLWDNNRDTAIQIIFPEKLSGRHISCFYFFKGDI